MVVSSRIWFSLRKEGNLITTCPNYLNLAWYFNIVFIGYTNILTLRFYFIRRKGYLNRLIDPFKPDWFGYGNNHLA